MPLSIAQTETRFDLSRTSGMPGPNEAERMLRALLIIVDEDFGSPLYAEPQISELEPDHWHAVRELIVEVFEGDRSADGVEPHGDVLICWKVLSRNGLSFVAITEDLEKAEVESYLKQLVRHYFDEVDDVRRPDRDGVADVVLDVIPPWDD